MRRRPAGWADGRGRVVRRGRQEIRRVALGRLRPAESVVFVRVGAGVIPVADSLFVDDAIDLGVAPRRRGERRREWPEVRHRGILLGPYFFLCRGILAQAGNGPVSLAFVYLLLRSGSVGDDADDISSSTYVRRPGMRTARREAKQKRTCDLGHRCIRGLRLPDL